MTLDTATGAHALTDQQQSIPDAVASGRQTVVVKALAGTGKTSTLAAVARHLQETQPDKRLLYLALNEVTADEAKSRMPSNVEALTSKAMAHRAVPQHISRRMNPRAIRARDLIEQVGIKRDVYVGSHRLASPYDLARLALRTMERWCQSADPAPARAHVPAPSPGDGGDIHRTMELISYEASKGCATTEAEELAMEQALESAWSTVVERVLRIVNAWWERVVVEKPMRVMRSWSLSCSGYWVARKGRTPYERPWLRSHVMTSGLDPASSESSSAKIETDRPSSSQPEQLRMIAARSPYISSADICAESRSSTSSPAVVMPVLITTDACDVRIDPHDALGRAGVHQYSAASSWATLFCGASRNGRRADSVLPS